MNFFQTTKKTFATLGISSNQRTLNRKMLTFFNLFWLDVILNCMYTFREPNTIVEYAESIVSTMTTALIAMLYTIIIINWNAMHDVIEIIDELADKSKFD